MPFAVESIQVDGGSEFRTDVEESCAESGIDLFVLPPRSPELNGCVEHCNRGPCVTNFIRSMMALYACLI
jgi:hypothetical protein